MLLFTVILMDLLTGMEFDLFTPSFPELQHYFNLSAFWMGASLSANFIGFCLSLFFVGGLADRYGKKIIILIGLILFSLGSLFCVWAPDYVILLLGRILQGLGIAAPSILSFLIIADLYPLKQQQFLMAMLNGAMNIMVAIAPVIGSYVTLYFHWRANFVVLLTLGLVILTMTIFFIPYHKPQHQKSAVSLAGYKPIFQSKPLVLLMSALLLIFVPYWIFVGMSPILYIKNLSVSLSHFGYYQGVLALVFAVGSILYGLLIRNRHYDPKKMINISIIIFIVSLFIISYVTAINSQNPLVITLAILTFIIGQVIPTTILYPVCLNYMPQAGGRVSAVIQGAKLILAAIGVQVAGYFYDGTFQNIGIIFLWFVLAGIISLCYVTKSHTLMEAAISRS